MKPFDVRAWLTLAKDSSAQKAFAFTYLTTLKGAQVLMTFSPWRCHIAWDYPQESITGAVDVNGLTSIVPPGDAAYLGAAIAFAESNYWSPIVELIEPVEMFTINSAVPLRAFAHMTGQTWQALPEEDTAGKLDLLYLHYAHEAIGLHVQTSQLVGRHGLVPLSAVTRQARDFSFYVQTRFVEDALVPFEEKVYLYGSRIDGMIGLGRYGHCLSIMMGISGKFNRWADLSAAPVLR